MKKIKRIVALIMIFASSMAFTQNNQVEASISVYDNKLVYCPEPGMMKIKFSEDITIIYGDTASYYIGTSNIMFRKDRKVDEAYLIGFQEGVGSIVDIVGKDPIRVFFVKDKNYTRATVKGSIDYNNICSYKKNNKIVLDIPLILHGFQASIFIKNEAHAVIHQKVTLDPHDSIMDVFLRGYVDGAQAVLDFVSSDSLGVINYLFFMEDKK